MPPGVFVDAARLHADEAVLDHVDAPDAVGPGHVVEPAKQRRRPQALAVDGHRVAGLEVDLDGGRLIRRLLGRHRAREHGFVGLHPRVLQRLAFVGDVQEVGVHGIWRLALGVPRHRDLVGLGVLDQLGARGQVPFPPRRDDLDVGLERVIGKLEAHLVVALAGRAVGDGVGADLLRDFDLALGDQGPGDGRAQEVGALVERVGPEHGEDVVTHEHVLKVLDENLLDAQGLGGAPRRPQFLALADVGGECDHLAAIGVLKPAQDDRGVETARVGQHDLLHAVFHDGRAPKAAWADEGGAV